MTLYSPRGEYEAEQNRCRELGVLPKFVIFTVLGGEYKAEQNHCRELGVLPKFHSKAFLKIHESPSADDFEGKKRLHSV